MQENKKMYFIKKTDIKNCALLIREQISKHQLYVQVLLQVYTNKT